MASIHQAWSAEETPEQPESEHAPADLTGGGPPHPSMPPGRIEHILGRVANIVWYANSAASQVTRLLRDNLWISFLVIGIGSGFLGGPGAQALAGSVGVMLPGWLDTILSSHAGAAITLGTPWFSYIWLRRRLKRRTP